MNKKQLKKAYRVFFISFTLFALSGSIFIWCFNHMGGIVLLFIATLCAIEMQTIEILTKSRK